MKKIFLLIALFVTVLTISCKKESFLDTKTTASLNEEITFADSTNTMDFLAGLYVDMSYYFQITPAHNQRETSKITDEGEGRYPAGGNFDKIFTQGTFANTYFNNYAADWLTFYGNIRKANILLRNMDRVPLSEAKKKRIIAEARFLRVLYYHYLTRAFGGVPIVQDEVFDTNAVGTLVRNTWEECVNYMVSELDACANDLPPNYTGLDYGRITNGAALALKSRILLYAASPLYNGGGTSDKPELQKLLSYPTADRNRWEAARRAAEAVMNLHIYDLYTDNSTPWSGSATGKGQGFYEVFITRVNNEFILSRLLPNGKQVEQGSLPRSRGGANFYFYPTQEMVDKFPTINGKSISSDVKSMSNPQGYDVSNPYANRDPRLSATVIYNGSKFFLNSTKALSEVNTYVGAPSDGLVEVSKNTATITGYYSRKMCDEYAAMTGGSNVERGLPIIRYAEILLNYAEATNELDNSSEAMEILKELRIRAGINPGPDGMYGLPASPLKDEASELIKNERAIELAFEQHRLWDIRRWKDGPTLDGKYVHGMRITKSGSSYSYQVIDVRTRYFKDIYYYFPIPKDEVTLNPALLQNPGY
ncbi:RagB/SusD family nutrient uptake outer membrane protein [Desertivirga xinjiangensis]|uniref:RagB/SusD family nutrient uptake outer membrane protein n=1 Tax=Desertivirga xinjiangensis TaxID=539206 RepID=UPI00210E06F0|nr:RagB/SusD family nutrient uptake outer membrane protein [Pedobacter xinjiangensis]